MLHCPTEPSEEINTWRQQLLELIVGSPYTAVIEIDLAEIHEPIVARPNDPDDVKTLSRRGRRRGSTKCSSARA